MNFRSTPDSAARGEITLLAILETVLAVALSLALMKLLDTSAHIVVGALIAPFLLLRTEASTTTAFKMFDSCLSKLAKQAAPEERLAARPLIWLPLIAFVAIVVKFVATLASVISSPRDTLRAIPGNWVRLALATDYKHPPELLPGMETDPDTPAGVQRFRYEEMGHEIASGNGSAFVKKLCVLAPYVCAVIYRLFLKSTSLIYFPLIWVSEVPMSVKGVLTLPLERVRRWYAAVVILVMLSPLVISFHAQNTLATIQDRAVFTYILPVGKIDWWHVARAVAVAVTIVLYLYARKLGDDSLEHPETERRIITGANWLRAACGVFTMACFLVIVFAL